MLLKKNLKDLFLQNKPKFVSKKNMYINLKKRVKVVKKKFKKESKLNIMLKLKSWY